VLQRARGAQPAVYLRLRGRRDRIRGAKVLFLPLGPIHTVQMSGAVSVGENEKPQTIPERPLTWKDRWVPRLKLMAGLLLPVYLETLDYTGTLL
jgi:hypothetical protein